MFSKTFLATLVSLVMLSFVPAQAYHITGAPLAPAYAPFFPLGGTDRWWLQGDMSVAIVCEEEYFFPPTHTSLDPSPGISGLCSMSDYTAGPALYPGTDYVKIDMVRATVSAASSSQGWTPGFVDFYCSTGSFLAAVAPGSSCYVNRNYLVTQGGHTVGYVTKIHPGSGLVLSNQGDTGSYVSIPFSSAAAYVCPADTVDVSGGTGFMCVGAVPAYPPAQFGFHSASVLGFKAYAVNGVPTGWSCFHPMSGAVTTGSVVPTPTMTCFPPVAPAGAANFCRRIGEVGYAHLGTGGGITVTTTCSGGLSNTLFLNLPGPTVTNRINGISPLDSVTCSVAENSVSLLTDWWVVCTVNMNYP